MVCTFNILLDHSCPSRDFSGVTRGASCTDETFSYFGRNFSFPTAGAGARHGLFALAVFILCKVGKDREGGGGSTWRLGWRNQGMEMHGIVRVIGRCLDPSSACWTTARIWSVLLVWGCVLCNSLFTQKEKKNFCKTAGEVAWRSRTSEWKSSFGCSR